MDLEKAAKEIESSETDMFSLDDDNQLSEKKEAPPKKPAEKPAQSLTQAKVPELGGKAAGGAAKKEEPKKPAASAN